MVSTCVPLPTSLQAPHSFSGNSSTWALGLVHPRLVSLLRCPVKLLLILPVAPQPINVPTPPTRSQNLPSTVHLPASSFKKAIHQKTSGKTLEVCRQLAHISYPFHPCNCLSDAPGGRFPLYSNQQPFPVLFLAEEMRVHSNHTTEGHAYLPPSPILPRKQW